MIIATWCWLSVYYISVFFLLKKKKENLFLEKSLVFSVYVSHEGLLKLKIRKKKNKTKFKEIKKESYLKPLVFEFERKLAPYGIC